MYSQFVKEYQESWKNKYLNEEKEIRNVLGDLVLDIQHIGSTAIVGSIAKPVIDIAVLVDDIGDANIFVEKVIALGYAYKPELSSPERIFFRKCDPVEYHLSITTLGFSFWDRQIIFRDYLAKHPELVAEYNNLKLENIKNTSELEFADLSLSESYNRGKGEFVNKVLNLAQQ
jgi:GrpB-like predicted nucleotidyltransferase (UPF0157 family)